MALKTQSNFAKTYEEFCQILKEHELATATKYVFTNGTKRFLQKDVSLGENAKIHWLGNMPYFHCGTRLFSCHQGKDQNLCKKRKYAQKRNLKACEDKSVRPFKPHGHTKKLNCPVMIHLTRIIKVLIRHPEYPPLDENPSRHMKRVYKLLIKDRMHQGKLNGEECYIFNLPQAEEHMYHYVGEEAIAKAISEPLPKRSTVYCCICKQAKHKNDQLTFHRVPRSEEALTLWSEIIGRPLRSDIHRVCSDHFSPSDFKKDIMENGKIRKVLLPNVLPRVETNSDSPECEIEESDHAKENEVENSNQQMKENHSALPFEHLYCAANDETISENDEVPTQEVYCEEIVGLEGCEIAFVDEIITDEVSQSLPEDIGLADSLDEQFETEAIEIQVEEEIAYDSDLAQSFEVQELEEGEQTLLNQEELDDLNQQLENIKQSGVLVKEEISIPADLNEMNEPFTEEDVEEPKTKRLKCDEELSEECFTNPKYFEIYQRHKRRVRNDKNSYKTQLLSVQSRCAQLNSILSSLRDQGIISTLRPSNCLSPLMCNIIDRALFDKKPKVRPELREFSCTLMNHSPTAYQYVREQLMQALPEEKTVKYWLRQDKPKQPKFHVLRKPAPPIL